jgi:hypothetical protein
MHPLQLQVFLDKAPIRHDKLHDAATQGLPLAVRLTSPTERFAE